MRKLLCLLLCMSLMTLFFAVPAQAATCGDSLTWSVDDDGTLTISGVGDMYDFSSYNKSPWYSKRLAVKRVVLQEGVTSVGACAFDEFSELSEAIIPDGVTAIWKFAFYGCEKLADIDIPNSVTDIGEGAFCCCDGFTEITIPNGVKAIGNSAFSNCENLTRVNISDSVTSIGYGAFGRCYSLTDISVSKANSGYCSVDGNLFNKSKTQLVQYAAAKEDTEYTIPDSITSICAGAFEYSVNLVSVAIPGGVTSIGQYAFNRCYNLEKVNIPSGVTSICDYTFADCRRLTSINIPNGVTSIGNCSFSDCQSLTDINMSGSIERIGSMAFYCCSSLTNVYYDKSKAEWRNIIIESNNDCLLCANIEYKYAVRFIGDYIGVLFVDYGTDVKFPEPPCGYEYVFLVNGFEWTGRNVKSNVLVTVKKLCNLTGMTVRNLRSVSVNGTEISGKYYDKNFIPEITVSENAKYAFYTDAECTAQVTGFKLSNGENKCYVKVIAESRKTEVYTLTVYRHSGISIETIDALKSDGKFIYDFSVISDKTVSGEFIVAIYDADGKMLKMINPSTLRDVAEARISSVTDCSTDASAYKAFLWKDMNTALPLVASANGNIR